MHGQWIACATVFFNGLGWDHLLVKLLDVEIVHQNMAKHLSVLRGQACRALQLVQELSELLWIPVRRNPDARDFERLLRSQNLPSHSLVGFRENDNGAQIHFGLIKVLVDGQEVRKRSHELINVKVEDGIRRKLSFRDSDVVEEVVLQTNVVLNLCHTPSAIVAHASD